MLSGFSRKSKSVISVAVTLSALCASPVFAETTDSQPQPLLTMTMEQKEKVSGAWAAGLKKHSETLAAAFERYMPNDYHGFAQYKVKHWLPAYNKDKAIIDEYWPRLADKQKLADMRAIVVAWSDLNTASIHMQSYLKYNKKTDLKMVSEKLNKIMQLTVDITTYCNRCCDWLDI